MRAALLLPLLLVACSTPPPASKEPANPATPACDVALDKLAGTTWIVENQSVTKKIASKAVYRVRFTDNAGAVEANYTAGGLGDVYNYTCTPAGSTLTCVEKDLHADAWCKAYAAVHDGVCDPTGLGAAMGVEASAFSEAATSVNKELKALKGEAIATQRKADNNPNNKIRAKFLVALNMGTCKLTLQDKYQTMVDGKLQEFENVLGASTFAKSSEEYIWESCKDVEHTKAPDASGNHQRDQKSGAVNFEGTLATKANPACTYTADVYRDWAKFAPDQPATVEKGVAKWTASVPLTDKGLHTVYFDRKATCGEKVEDLGPTCAIVNVE